MMHFQLVSSQGTKFDDDIYEVIVPTQAGTISIFEDHMPLVAAGTPGVLSVRHKPSDSDSDLEHFAVNGGVVEVHGKDVRFLSEDITTSEEVSEAEAADALARAEQLVKSADNQTALNEAQRLMSHHGARLQVAKLKKHHHR